MSKHMSHDAIFKRFMSDPAVARDFLEIYLPAKIKAQCNFATLRIESPSFIEDHLKQHFADILYSLEINNNKGYIYCLIEHQSSPVTMMPFRMLRYSTSIMKRYIEAGHNRLPVVIPVLFYAGKQSPYPYSINLFDCFEDPQLAKEIMFGDLKLIDLTTISDEEIVLHKSVAMLELVQKHIFERDISNQLANQLANLLIQRLISHDLTKDMLQYLLINAEVSQAEEFLNIISNDAVEYEEELMTIEEYLIQKGVQKGIQQGLQQGLQQGMHEVAKNLLLKGLSIELIAEVTQLSLQEVEQLALENQSCH